MNNFQVLSLIYLDHLFFSSHWLAKGKNRKFSWTQRQKLHDKESSVNPPVWILDYRWILDYQVEAYHTEHFLLQHYMRERNVHLPALFILYFLSLCYKSLVCVQTHTTDNDNKVFSPSVTQSVVFTHKQVSKTRHKRNTFYKGTGQG